jgi:hypothetical protein
MVAENLHGRLRVRVVSALQFDVLDACRMCLAITSELARLGTKLRTDTGEELSDDANQVPQTKTIIRDNALNLKHKDGADTATLGPKGTWDKPGGTQPNVWRPKFHYGTRGRY